MSTTGIGALKTREENGPCEAHVAGVREFTTIYFLVDFEHSNMYLTNTLGVARRKESRTSDALEIVANNHDNGTHNEKNDNEKYATRVRIKWE